MPSLDSCFSRVGITGSFVAVEFGGAVNGAGLRCCGRDCRQGSFVDNSWFGTSYGCWCYSRHEEEREEREVGGLDEHDCKFIGGT